MKMDLTSPRVMTIINATPDSFFEGSRTLTPDLVAERVQDALVGGADMLDVGGYSSRPGAEDVSAQEELERVSMAVGVIRELAPEVVVSVDTFRSEVAEAILNKFGEVVINDISASELDPRMVSVVAEAGVPYVAMHLRGTPQDMAHRTSYVDIVDDIKEYFERKIEFLEARGVRDLILDPGFGFAKTLEQNHELLFRLDEAMPKEYPFLVGLSRKSMIYKPLEISPSESLAGTTALHWESLRKGASILRVHDTEEASQIIKLFNYYGSVNSSQ